MCVISSDFGSLNSCSPSLFKTSDGADNIVGGELETRNNRCKFGDGREKVGD